MTARPMGATTQRALFLSGSFGKGHDTLAEACEGALGRHGVQSEMLDSIKLLGNGPGAVGDWIFRRLLSSTPVYDAFHFSQLRGDGPLGRFVDKTGVNVMLPLLREEAARFDPQLVVSVFATGAGAAVHLKADQPDLITVVFLTDSFAHRMWVHEGTDLFLVTSAMAAASVRRYWPEAPVEVVNAPVRPGFYDAPTKAEARRRVGVPDGVGCVLLMSGAWGMGPLDEVADALAAAGYWVLAVGGINKKLARRLQAVASVRPEVIPFGYTDRIPELMAASDVIVTSSGDTCREARVIGRGLILLDVVPGHGRENLMHELELGNAAVCSPEAASVLGTVRQFLASGAAAEGEAAGAEAGQAASAVAWDDEFVVALSKAGVVLPG
jgi:processive 1,2-diacylglycerol beta-glucosyltransferase